MMRDAVGIRYHFREVLYAFSLLATAVRFRANWAVLIQGLRTISQCLYFDWRASGSWLFYIIVSGQMGFRRIARARS